MAKKRRIMTKMRLDEISTVDRPAQAPALGVMMKRADVDSDPPPAPEVSAAALAEIAELDRAAREREIRICQAAAERLNKTYPSPAPAPAAPTQINMSYPKFEFITKNARDLADGKLGGVAYTRQEFDDALMEYVGKQARRDEHPGAALARLIKENDPTVALLANAARAATEQAVPTPTEVEEATAKRFTEKERLWAAVEKRTVGLQQDGESFEGALDRLSRSDEQIRAMLLQYNAQ